MTRSEILQAVRAWIKTLLTLTDEEVIPANAGGVRQGFAGIAVQVSGSTGDGAESTFMRDATGDPIVRVTEQRQTTVSVSTYGASADTWSQTIATAWRSRQPASEALRTAGLHPSDASAVRDLTGLRDTGPEPRHQLDLTGYHLVSLEDTGLTVVEQIDVSIEMDPGPNVSTSTTV